MKKKNRSSLVLLLIAVFFASSAVMGQVGMKPHHLEKIKNVSQVAVSPDGQQVAYLLYIPKPITEGVGTSYRQLWVYDVKSGEHTPLLDKDVKVTATGWTPGGEYITYRKSASDGKGMQVFAITPDGEEEKQLTAFDGSVRAYDFIDDKTLALTATAPQEQKKSELTEMGFDMNIVEEELRDVDLWRYDLESGSTQQLKQGVSVFDFTVSPDGKKIAAAIAPENTTDNSYMFKRIHILDADNGATLEKIENPGKLAGMAWSPDSKRLAFRAAAKEADAVTGSLFVFETGKEVAYDDIKNVVEGMELSVIDMAWKDKHTLLFASEESVDITVRSLDVKKMNIKVVLDGGKAVFRGFGINDDHLFFAGNTPSHPSELMIYDIEDQQLTKVSSYNDWLEDVALARQEKISYHAEDGTRIDGVLVYPLNYTEGTRYPLITYIHGGPEAAVHNGWNTRYSTWGQFAADKGFFVFYPNYRASSGRGVDFTMEGFNDLLGKEYSDVLDGIDYLIAEGMVDEKRVGIGGGSYGGYFAAWSATKHTERFAAAVVFVGVTNQVSKRNITDIPYEDYLVHWGFWNHEDIDRVWEASPVKYAHQSKTPTLILHGEEDPRIPVTQGEELYRAMKVHADAPVRFVTYPGEGHGNRKNTNRYDYLVRTLNWFDYYLNENPGAEDMPAKYPEYNLKQ